MSSRQQLRNLERAHVKRGRSAMASGLPQTPDKDAIVGVALVLVRVLGDGALAGRASEAAAQALGLLDVSARKSPGTAKLDCGKGCAYCCFNWVGATAPEVFLLARAVRMEDRKRPGHIAGVIERSGATAGRTPQERFGLKAPCPLLINGACGHYRERPAVCRQVTSFDVAGCIDEFEGRGRGEDIKVSAVHLAHARNSRVPLVAALRISGLDAKAYELSAALVVALAEDDTEARWLAGEDVFGTVARAPPEPASAEGAIAMIEAELAPLLR